MSLDLAATRAPVAFHPACAACACALLALVARAQDAAPPGEPDLTELSLEELMTIEIESVRGASRRVQTTLEAPSSVSLVDAHEIRAFDRRTLAEILRSIGGFDVTDDRNYEHLGVRGFNPLGDYNSRVLLTLDGHRLNNAVYDTAPIGRDLPFDVGLAERVEVVRGPGSALYGSNAFFGVVELRPRTGADLGGLEVSAGAASWQGYEARATLGRALAGGGDWLVSASGYRSEGPTLFYDDFGAATSGTDDEQGYSAYSRWSQGEWTVAGGLGSREKGIPTASFGTVFDAESHTTDAQAFLDVAWRGELGTDTALEARLAYDQYDYDGLYAYDMTASGGSPEEPYYDDAHAIGATASALVTTTAWEGHTATFGGEARRNFQLDQHAYDAFGTYTDAEHLNTSVGAFASDEWRFAERWRLDGGLRLDDASDVDVKASPRLGLIWMADDATAWKLLYGRAFRAPNAYERFYGDGSATKPNPGLLPEEIETFELAWQRVIEGSWRAGASLYHYEIDDLIVQGVDPSDGIEQFRNLENVRASGLELECERTLDEGARVRASWALQYAENVTLGEELVNSPRQLGKLLLETPLWRDDLRLALEAQATSSRLTYSGDRTSPFVVVHATLLAARLADGVELAVGVRNVLDAEYYDPVGTEITSDRLLQNGRSFRVRLTVSR